MSPQPLCPLERKDIFSLIEIFRKALEFKGLKLREGSTRAESEPFLSVSVNNNLINSLVKHGIRQVERTDKILTLEDKNSQPLRPGHEPSNYWNFDISDNDRKAKAKIDLQVGLMDVEQERGIVFRPLAYGGSVCPADRLPHFRMFKALVEVNPDNVPPIAKELAASEGFIVVSWTDLGLGGLRKLSKLFEEFANGREAILQLRGEEKIFNPVAGPSPGLFDFAKELFIIEPAQPRILKAWRDQLENYRGALHVA